MIHIMYDSVYYNYAVGKKCDYQVMTKKKLTMVEAAATSRPVYVATGFLPLHVAIIVPCM